MKYTKALIDKGLIRESDREESTGGRRSSVLELNPEAGLEIVILLEATTVRGSLLDISGRALVEDSAPSRQGVPREELLAAMFGLVDTLLSRASGYQGRILGIGIGLGGYIDPREGISHEYLYARDWYDVPLRRLVEERYTVPCYLVNDANCLRPGGEVPGHGGWGRSLPVRLDR